MEETARKQYESVSVSSSFQFRLVQCMRMNLVWQLSVSFWSKVSINVVKSIFGHRRKIEFEWFSWFSSENTYTRTATKWCGHKSIVIESMHYYYQWRWYSFESLQKSFNIRMGSSHFPPISTNNKFMARMCNNTKLLYVHNIWKFMVIYGKIIHLTFDSFQRCHS